MIFSFYHILNIIKIHQVHKVVKIMFHSNSYSDFYNGYENENDFLKKKILMGNYGKFIVDNTKRD